MKEGTVPFPPHRSCAERDDDVAPVQLMRYLFRLKYPVQALNYLFRNCIPFSGVIAF